MKYILLTSLLFFSINVFAQDGLKEENTWIFDRLNMHIDNDKYYGTDHGYTTGESITALYRISKENYSIYDILGYADEDTHAYIAFSLTNQIYTPTDTLNQNLIRNDRPYAGWTYLESSIHKTTQNQLRSLSLKVGVVGPAFHRLIQVNRVQGWHNQLENEIGINIKYTQKWRYFSKYSNGLESSVIPFLSAEFGNIAIGATAGMMARIGFNIPKDYGVSTINNNTDPGIPIYGEYNNQYTKPWSFSLNLAAAGSFIARDIFLDGNTFKNSHSVNIEHLVAVGTTLRYKRIMVDIMATQTTKQFDLQQKSEGVGSIIVSLLF